MLIAIAQVGAMSTWFSAAAVTPSLARDWQLSTGDESELDGDGE